MNSENNLSLFLTINTIGLSILAETLRSAAIFVTNSNGIHRRERRNCFAFVQGTGLDLIIQNYNLGYDPNQLRSDFNYYLHRHLSS